MKYMPTYLDWKLAKQLDISTTKLALYDFGAAGITFHNPVDQ